MNLNTSTLRPQLEQQLLQQQVKIEAWLREQLRLTPPPFYTSVDLRNSTFKIAPVDTNLFPAGFNNLHSDMLPLCIQAAQSTIEQICPDVTRILLIPESHTRNIHYLENVAVLHEILTKAGFEVRLGSLLEDLTAAKEVVLPSGRKLLLEPLQREDDRVGVKDFYPCLILLNNDLSGDLPEIFADVKQKFMPPLALGWSTRLKSTHFKHYKNVAEEFAKAINLDPWLINPLFRNCGEVNFMTHEGEECLIYHTNTLLKAIKEKYEQYKIDLEPFVVVKADAGTYGMAVMTVRDAEELRNLNRKQRTNMSKVKSGQEVTKVIMQEGVYTFEKRNNGVAEPVVYMIGRHVVGGFYRVHNERGQDENLNAPGSHFEPLPFATPCNNPLHNEACEHDANRFYIYGVIARLALVAAARELAETK